MTTCLLGIDLGDADVGVFSIRLGHRAPEVSRRWARDLELRLGRADLDPADLPPIDAAAAAQDGQEPPRVGVSRAAHVHPEPHALRFRLPLLRRNVTLADRALLREL